MSLSLLASSCENFSLRRSTSELNLSTSFLIAKTGSSSYSYSTNASPKFRIPFLADLKNAFPALVSSTAAISPTR